MAKEGKVSASLFDRLAKTDTYASRRLKEKRFIQSDDNAAIGRPLYRIDVSDSKKSTGSPRGVTDITPASSFSSRSTASTYSTRSRSSIPASPMKKTSSRPRSAASSVGSPASASGGRQSVFDRLANTGTKSSLRKHKKSDLYVDIKERPKEESLLREFEGDTNVLASNLHRPCEEKRKKKPTMNKNKAAVKWVV